MKVLLVSAFVGADRLLSERAEAILAGNGHELVVIRADEEGFDQPMTADEREMYHEEGENILSPEVQRSVDELSDAEGLLFCFRTSADMAPPPIKNWLDRVLLPGVSFGFNDKGKVVPKLTQIKRLGLVTVAPAGRRPSEAARRTILWTIRLSCGLNCRRSFVAAPTAAELIPRFDTKLGRW